MEEIALFVLPVDLDGDEDEQIKEVPEEGTIREAEAEHEKKMAELKAAAHAAEAAKSAVEEESKKNASTLDADKAPLEFTDATGRNFTLPWHLVKTWNGMETLIRQAFVNLDRIGPHVANGQYDLVGPNDEIILPQVWDIVVQPGWNIRMQLWPMTESTEEDIASSLALVTGSNEQGVGMSNPVLGSEVKAVMERRKGENEDAAAHALPTQLSAIVNGAEEDEGEIVCICGMYHEDGFAVQCDTCKNWQHMVCYYPTEASRPSEQEEHHCIDCRPRWVDTDQAKERQKKQIQRQALMITGGTQAAADEENAPERRPIVLYEKHDKDETEYETYQEVLRYQQKEQQEIKEGNPQAFLLEQKEQQDSKREDLEEDYIHSSLGESSPPYTSPTSGLSRRSSPSPVPQRDYILDPANPERANSGGNDPKWTQKHPATYQCALCPKKFTRAYNLRFHLRTHEDERPFVCAVCGKAFARQHDRKRHESLHSGENKGWPQEEEQR
ncbi:hypothetical protein KCU71_g3208, partial [Aureobasidium melanogenum]